MHEEEVKVAEQNWQLLVADETFKQSRCKYCPNCNRVIERIDGCDTMVCGQNAHGGNIQNGCGHGFNWLEAGAYVPDAGNRRTITPFAGTPPDEVSRVQHQIVEGEHLKCDVCQADLKVSTALLLRRSRGFGLRNTHI